jgi:hypothetical protein
VIVLFVNVSDPARVASVPVVGNVTSVVAVVVSVRAWAPALIKSPESIKALAVVVRLVPDPATTTILFALPAIVGSFAKPASMFASSARMDADNPADPVDGNPV